MFGLFAFIMYNLFLCLFFFLHFIILNCFYVQNKKFFFSCCCCIHQKIHTNVAISSYIGVVVDISGIYTFFDSIPRPLYFSGSISFRFFSFLCTCMCVLLLCFLYSSSISLSLWRFLLFSLHRSCCDVFFLLLLLLLFIVFFYNERIFQMRIDKQKKDKG